MSDMITRPRSGGTPLPRTRTGPTEQQNEWVRAKLKVPLKPSGIVLGSNAPKPVPNVSVTNHENDNDFVRARVQASNRLEDEFKREIAQTPGLTEGIRTELETRTSAARESLSKPTTAEEAGVALETAMKVLESAEQFVRNDIKSHKGQAILATDQQNQERAAQQKKLNEQFDLFRTEAAKVESQAKALLDFDPGAAKTALDQIASLRTATEKNSTPVLGIDNLKQITLGITKSEQTAKGGTIAEDAKTLEAEIKTLREEVSKAASAKPNAPLADAFKALLGEVDQVKTLASTANAGAFEAARTQIAAIRAAASGPVLTIFAQRHADITATTKRGGPVQTDYPDDCKEVADGLAALIKTLDLLQLAEAAGPMRDLAQQAQGLADKITNLAKWRNGIKGRLASLEKMTKVIDGFLKGTPMAKRESTAAQAKIDLMAAFDKPGVDQVALEKQLFAAEAATNSIMLGLQKGRGPDYAQALERLGQDAEAAKNLTLAREQQKTKKEDEAKQQKQQLQTCQQRLDTLNKGLDQVEKEIDKLKKSKQPADTESLKELRTLADQVKTKLKEKDCAGAAKQLDSLENRLETLKSEPGGITMSSAKDLKNVEQKWTSAFATTRKKAGEIVDKARPLVGEAGVDETALENVVESAVKRLEAFATVKPYFLALATENPEDKDDLKKRKAAREAALNGLRGMRAMLQTDPVAAKLKASPFGGDPFADMAKFIDSLEYNAMRAVLAE